MTQTEELSNLLRFRSALNESGLQTKACSQCTQRKSMSEFGTMRRRGRIDVMAECRDCKRGRDRRAVAEDPERLVGITARRKRQVSLNCAELAKYRSSLSCSTCQTPGTEKKLMLLGGQKLDIPAFNGLSLQTLMTAARETTPLCYSCYRRAHIAANPAPETPVTSTEPMSQPRRRDARQQA